MKGFTFIEIIIAVAITVLLVILIAPWGIDFYRTRQIDNTAQEVVQALRRAQLLAMSASLDSSFGVYFASGKYSIFRGSSYALKTDEEAFDVLGGISFSGPQEIVFSKLAGIPNNTGNVVLTSGKNIKTININSIGRINL